MRIEPQLYARACLLGERLSQQQKILSTAESCTGGLIAAAITAVAGSSAWFEEGFVVYSNAAKTRCLGVDAALLASAGAVSEAVVRAMADGALAASGAHLALAVSGIAGPGGGSAAKPVGRVCVGWAASGGVVRSATFDFAGDRAAVRLAASCAALDGALALLETTAAR